MGWSNKYKKSIDCNNPKGFSQKAHCQGRKKRKENTMKISELKNEIKNIMKEFQKALPKKKFQNISSRHWVVALPKQTEHKNKDVKFVKATAAWEDN